MRKYILSVALMLHCIGVVLHADAQISYGGTPLLQSEVYLAAPLYVPQVILPSPDIDALIEEDKTAQAQNPLEPFRVGYLVAANITIADGSITTAHNGDRLWRLQIRVPNAPALGVYYKRFRLPEGVRYFITNGNGRQLLGAYTSESNPGGGRWATEKVQGDIINLELDIPYNIDIGQIDFVIDDVCVFYKALTAVNAYAETAGSTARKTAPVFTYGGSSPCQVNAICEPGNNFEIPRKASVHIEYVIGRSAVAGSGTLINNTSGDCKPYILTASHIEKTNSTHDSTFEKWMFYFNYETPTCNYAGSTPNSSQSMSGAYFRARSSFISQNFIVGDFLLVELKSKVPASYNAWFSGWDRSGKLPSGPCISFHHPVGDVKKLMYSDGVPWADGTWSSRANTHWDMDFAKGGNESGSSGSGLFNPEGRFIGDLTGGGYAAPLACSTKNDYNAYMSNYGKYSKLSENWSYTYQQPSTASSRLKDWLDPQNTGMEILDAMPATCFPAGIASAQNKKESSFKVYPNPANGDVNLDIREVPEDVIVTVDIVNIQGSVLSRQVFNHSGSNVHRVLLQDIPAGVYLLHIHAGGYSSIEKIVKIR